MGKVLKKFTNGWPGAVSRSIDDIIISMKNGTSDDIAFGTPLFLSASDNTAKPFDASTSTPETFLGIAVRSADKTPEEYGGNEGKYKAGDPVEVLVRGSTVLCFENNASAGSSVYIRKSDKKLVTSPGAEGTTVLLPGVTVRNSRDANRATEVVLTKRNIY